MEVRGQLHVPAALSLGKEWLVPIEQNDGRGQSRSGRFG
jgi:hypothetical protein